MYKDKRKHSSHQTVSNQRDKHCAYCKAKAVPKWQDYEQLREYLSPRGRILSRAVTFVCAHHQKRLAESIKQARHLALLPFTTIE